jgi:hypothetical protein
MEVRFIPGERGLGSFQYFRDGTQYYEATEGTRWVFNHGDKIHSRKLQVNSVKQGPIIEKHLEAAVPSTELGLAKCKGASRSVKLTVAKPKKTAASSAPVRGSRAEVEPAKVQVKVDEKEAGPATAKKQLSTV